MSEELLRARDSAYGDAVQPDAGWSLATRPEQRAADTFRGGVDSGIGESSREEPTTWRISESSGRWRWRWRLERRETRTRDRGASSRRAGSS